MIETKVPDPMFNLELFRIRAFTAGNIANFLGAIGRGGLQFMLIIWLQGIWLPAARLQLRAHATVGRHLHAADHRRLPARRPGLVAGCRTSTAPRWFATGGMLLAARRSAC